MKRLLLSALLVTALAGFGIAQGRMGQQKMAPATGPGADMAKASVEAINKGDSAYFDAHLAPEVVWLDEDGHAIRGKMAVANFMKRQLMTGGKKITMTGLTAGNTNDAAWATFFYTIEGGATPTKGTMTSVYKKVGNDWQIVLVHGAKNFPSGHGGN
jgi:ketosteroid isomerase-like protein